MREIDHLQGKPGIERIWKYDRGDWSETKLDFASPFAERDTVWSAADEDAFWIYNGYLKSRELPQDEAWPVFQLWERIGQGSVALPRFLVVLRVGHYSDERVAVWDFPSLVGLLREIAGAVDLALAAYPLPADLPEAEARGEDLG